MHFYIYEIKNTRGRSKTLGTFHRLEIIPVYKSFAPQKKRCSFHQNEAAGTKRSPVVERFSFFFTANNSGLFISAITAQTDSSLARLSSPITFISTSNLISPKERKANKQRREERQGEKGPAIMSVCVGKKPQSLVFVCVLVYIPTLFCSWPHSLYILFSSERKPSKQRLCRAAEVVGW